MNRTREVEPINISIYWHNLLIQYCRTKYPRWQWFKAAKIYWAQEPVGWLDGSFVLGWAPSHSITCQGITCQGTSGLSADPGQPLLRQQKRGEQRLCILCSSRLAWACPHADGCSRRVQTETLQSFFTVLYGSPFANTPLVKKLTWPNSESGGKEINPTCLVRRTIKSQGTGAWIQGGKRYWSY